MSDSVAPDRGHLRRKPRRLLALWIPLLVAVAVALPVWAFLALGGASLFHEQPLRVTLLNDPWNVTDIEEDTTVLCADLECVEGWRTSVGLFLRYPSTGTAEYWQYVTGPDSVRNGTVVLDMNGFDLTIDQRRAAVDVLFPGRDW